MKFSHCLPQYGGETQSANGKCLLCFADERELFWGIAHEIHQIILESDWLYFGQAPMKEITGGSDTWQS